MAFTGLTAFALVAIASVAGKLSVGIVRTSLIRHTTAMPAEKRAVCPDGVTRVTNLQVLRASLT